MANLSNINNILRTGSLGVGINRDPASPFEVSSATKPGIKMFNTAASGKTYQAYSDINGSYIIYDEDADSNRLTINSGGNATFAGEIRTANRLAIKETYFGYSSGYKVVQYGESAATKAISLGYDPSGNTSGSFSGNEILIPNNIRVLAPAATNSGYYGLMMLNNANKVLLGSSNYLMESNYIMALDPATKNVGIGTDSPSANLHVQSTSTATLKVITTGVADASVNIQGYDAGVHIGDATNGLRWAIWNDGPSTSSSLKFGSYALGTWYNDGSQVVTMKSDGKVGIGTVSPAEKLTIDGTTSGAYVRISNAASGDISSGYTIYNGTNLDYSVYTNPTFGNTTLLTREALAIRAGGGERIRITSGGEVGIGTTNPSGRLEVNGNNYNDNTLTTFTLRDLGNNYGDGDNAIDIVMRSRYWSGDANTSQNSKIRHLKDNSNGSTGTMLQFGTTTEGSGDATTKMTIKANGTVGIGTATPLNKLQVNGDIGIGEINNTRSTNVRFAKNDTNVVTFSISVPGIGAWRPGSCWIQVSGAQNGLQEYWSAWYFIRLTHYYLSGVAGQGTTNPSCILDSGGNTSSVVVGVAATNTTDPQIITITLTDVGGTTNSMVADINCTMQMGIISIT